MGGSAAPSNALAAATALLLVCCAGDGGDAAGDDAGPDGDTDADTDTDADDCTPVDWGALTDFTVGQPVGNWVHTGYFDGDGDGHVEEQAIELSLEEIHCAGYESIVLMVGDTS